MYTSEVLCVLDLIQHFLLVRELCKLGLRLEFDESQIGHGISIQIRWSLKGVKTMGSTN